MRIITKTFIWAIVCLILSTSAFSSNIVIIESQSIHPLHKMDENWKNISESLGHEIASVVPAYWSRPQTKSAFGDWVVCCRCRCWTNDVVDPTPPILPVANNVPIGNPYECPGNSIHFDIPHKLLMSGSCLFA